MVETQTSQGIGKLEETTTRDTSENQSSNTGATRCRTRVSAGHHQLTPFLMSKSCWTKENTSNIC